MSVMSSRNLVVGALGVLVALTTPTLADGETAQGRGVDVFAQGWQPAHALIIRDVVSHFDANQDGVVTLQEYMAGMPASFEKWNLTEDTFLQEEELPSKIGETMLAMMDANGDSFITYAEYEDVMIQIGYATDYDDDMQITATEIAEIVRWGRLARPARDRQTQER